MEVRVTVTLPYDTAAKFDDYAHPEMVVSAEWVAGHLDDPGLVVAESDEDVLLYETGHIPGAVKLDWHTELNDPVTRDYVDGAGFARLMSQKGIGRDTTLVLYGDKHNWWAPCAAGTSLEPRASRGHGRPPRMPPSAPAPSSRRSTPTRRACTPMMTWWFTAVSGSGPATPGSCSTTCSATRTCATTTGLGPNGGTASGSPSPVGRARDRCHSASPAAGDSRRLQRRHGPGPAAAAAGVLPGAAAAPG